MMSEKLFSVHEIRSIVDTLVNATERIAGVKVIPMKDAGMVELSFAIGFLISFFLTIIFVAIINAISSMRKEGSEDAVDAAEGSAVEVKKRKERKVRVYMNEKPAGAKTCSGAVEIIKDSVQAGKRVVIKWAMKPWKHTTRGTAELNKDVFNALSIFADGGGNVETGELLVTKGTLEVVDQLVKGFNTEVTTLSVHINN